MKKFIIIALILIVVVVGGALAYIVVNASSIVAQLKPQIEQTASDTLGSPVKIGKIDVSVLPKTELIVDTFQLGKGKETFTLNNLTFRANLLPLINGNIDIREISLSKPTITIIQGKDGARIAGLPKAKIKRKKGKKKQQNQVTEKDATPAAAAVPEGISLNLEKFQIADASMTVVNEAQKKLITITNINVNSTVTYSDNLVTLPEFTFDASLNDKEPLQATGKNITFSLKNNDLDIPALDANAFGGTYNSEVSLSGKQELKTEATLKGVLFERVIEGFVPKTPTPITGTLESFTYNLSGSLKGNPAKNIGGKITLALKDGELLDTNLGGAVLKEVLTLPFFQEEALSAEDQAAMEADTTALKSLTGNFALSHGVMNTDDFQMSSALFDMTAQGTITVDAEIDLKSQFLFTKAVSTKLTSKVKEMKELLNDGERLVVPVAIKGKASDIKVLPDVKKLSQLGAEKAIEKGAQKLLDKAFGKNKDGSSKSNIDVGGLGKAFGF